MGLQFGVFDHIEPIPGQELGTIYKDRLAQLEIFDINGFYGYHLAEHHSPAVHSLAPSQNVFLSAASQRTKQIKLAPCIYVLPLHHPLRLIEEICMLDHLSDLQKRDIYYVYTLNGYSILNIIKRLRLLKN